MTSTLMRWNGYDVEKKHSDTVQGEFFTQFLSNFHVMKLMAVTFKCRLTSFSSWLQCMFKRTVSFFSVILRMSLSLSCSLFCKKSGRSFP